MRDSPRRDGANGGESPDVKSSKLPVGGRRVRSGDVCTRISENGESANSQKFLGEFSGN